MYDVIHVRRQLTHKGARRNIVALQSLSRSLVSTVQLNFSTELEHTLRLLLPGQPSEDPYAQSTRLRVLQRLTCKTSWTQGFNGVRCLNRIHISQTFLSLDKNGFSRSLLGVLPGDVSPL